MDATERQDRARRVFGGAVVALVALSLTAGSIRQHREEVAPGAPAPTGDLPPTADGEITATLGEGIDGIGAARVHTELGVSGAGQVIAVFDAGFDVAAIDDAAPGAVGMLGNFSRNEPYSNIQSGACTQHGTQVALRAAATAPAATIVPVVIRGKAACNMRVTEDAVRWALGLPVAGLQPNPTPATVLAWSFGALTPAAIPDEVCPLVAEAVSWGAVVVASAGNDATERAGDFFPGACDGALMVGNSGPSGGFEIDEAGFGSNRGPRVDLMAPAPSTSMAVPFVAGVVALARAANPALAAADAAATVRHHTQPFPVPCTGCGTGIVDAHRAVVAARAGNVEGVHVVELPAPTAPPLGFRPVVPARILDTRQPGAGGRLAAGQTRAVVVAGVAGVSAVSGVSGVSAVSGVSGVSAVSGVSGVSGDLTVAGAAGPAGSPLSADLGDGTPRAAILNVTGTAADGDGYLTVYPCDAPLPATSSVNVAAGGTAAAAVTVQLDAGGRVCVFTSTAVDAIVDVAGYFTTDAAALTYVADQTTPRVLDTRGQSPVAPDDAPRVVPVGGAAEGDAVTVNVTAIGRDAAGWVAITPCGAPSTGAVSNVNVAAGATVPNQATVRLGAGATICVSTGEAAIDVLVDVQGRWRAGDGARFVPIPPTRVVDSRTSIGVDDAAQIVPGVPVAYPVAPDGPVALAATVTATGSVRGGYLQVSPCDPVRIATNPSSALNVDGGAGARANGVYAPVDPASHSTCISAGPAPDTPLADVILDVTGWFTAA